MKFFNFIEDNFNKKYLNKQSSLDNTFIFKNFDSTPYDFIKINTLGDYKNKSISENDIFFYSIPLNFDLQIFKQNCKNNFKVYNKNTIYLLLLQHEYFFNFNDYISENTNKNFFMELNHYLDEFKINKKNTYLLLGNTHKKNIFQSKDFYNVYCNDYFLYSSKQRYNKKIYNLTNFKFKNKNIELYKFLYYNNRARLKRVLLFNELEKNNILKNSLFSNNWTGNKVLIEDIVRIFNDTYNFKNIDSSKASEILNQINNPVKSNIQDNAGININLQHYYSTLISIISESISDNKGMFISEKTYRPMCLGHPFIVYGNYGALRYLKTLGFETFSPFFDEDYDKEIDNEKRLNMVVHSILKLNSMTKEEIIINLEKINDKLNHNISVMQKINVEQSLLKILANIESHYNENKKSINN